MFAAIAALGGWLLAQASPGQVYAGVQQALLGCPALESYPITAVVRSDGAVLLAGVLPSQADRKLATEVVKEVPGVFGIRNRIKVDARAQLLPRSAPNPPSYPPLAAAIPSARATEVRLRTQTRIQQALGRVPALAGVTAKAYQGVVALTGVVKTPQARDRAGDVAHRSAGSVPVDNQVAVLPPAPPPVPTYAY